MDPDAIKKRLVNKAQKEKDRELNLKKAREEERQRQKKIEIEAFKEAKEILSQILEDLPVEGVEIKLTDTALTIYQKGFAGGSDTYKYFYNLAEEKLYLNHISRYGNYIDDFGYSSYDYANPSNNQSVNNKAFSSLEKFLADFEKTIQRFVSI